MKFEYRESGDGYLVRLEYSEQRIETSRTDSPKGSQKSSPKGSPKSSPKTADLILALIENDSRISAAQIGETLGISKRAVLKQTRGLKEAGRLRYVGPARGGHWEVLKG